MADSLTVIPGALRAGSGQLSALRDDVDRACSHAASALIGAAVACGDGPGFTSGLSPSVRALGPPLTQASAPLQDFAAALRTAQQRVDAHAAAYRSLYPLTLAGPNSPSGQDVPLVDSELAGRG